MTQHLRILLDAVSMYPNDFAPRVGHRFTFRVPPKPQLEDGLVVHCEVIKCQPPSSSSRGSSMAS